MGVDYDRRILRDVACSLLSTTLHNKGAKSTEINILLVLSEAHTNLFHKSFNSSSHVFFGNTCLLSNFVDDFCLGHFFSILYINNVKILFFLDFGLQRY